MVINMNEQFLTEERSSSSQNQRFLAEDDLYQHDLIQTMKDYGLIDLEEESLIQNYLSQIRTASEEN